MNEINNNMKDRRPERSKLALYSFLLSISPVWLYLLVFLIPYIDYIPVICIFFALLTILALPTALVFGIIAILNIRRSEGFLRGTGLAVGGILISVFFILCVVTLPFLLTYIRENAYPMMCGMNLKGLKKAMQLYSDDNQNRYPPPNKWCDLLVEHTEIDPNKFVCRASSVAVGKSSYAMNPNCEPNSPDDVVLLFETKGGWNQFGGAELLSFDNHNGEGCNVLFNSGRVRFVRPEELDKLNWGQEKAE
jgi:hypothetical protein